MLRLFIVLVLVAHGVGHSIGIAGGWGNNAGAAPTSHGC